jgi:hypothetical protein
MTLLLASCLYTTTLPQSQTTDVTPAPPTPTPPTPTAHPAHRHAPPLPAPAHTTKQTPPAAGTTRTSRVSRARSSRLSSSPTCAPRTPACPSASRTATPSSGAATCGCTMAWWGGSRRCVRWAGRGGLGVLLGSGWCKSASRGSRRRCASSEQRRAPGRHRPSPPLHRLVTAWRRAQIRRSLLAVLSDSAYNSIQSFHSDSAVSFAVFLHHLPDCRVAQPPDVLLQAMQVGAWGRSCHVCGARGLFATPSETIRGVWSLQVLKMLAQVPQHSAALRSWPAQLNPCDESLPPPPHHPTPPHTPPRRAGHPGDHQQGAAAARHQVCLAAQLCGV